MTDAAIAVQDVSKIYGDGATAVRALADVSLEVARGEVLLLVGPSGSGKTTLLSIMGAILQPTGGSVRIAGEEIVGRRERDLPAIRLRHIGFVFQGFNLFPALTVLENVALALDIRGIAGRAARRRAGEMLDRVGLGAKLDAMPEDLSGGQKQRVAIARALVGEPSILLADEPTAALDSHVGRVVMELLRSLAHDQGRAVVIVTHDSRVFDYGDRIAHIHDGRLSDEARDEAIGGARRGGEAGDAPGAASHEAAPATRRESQESACRAEGEGGESCPESVF